MGTEPPPVLRLISRCGLAAAGQRAARQLMMTVSVGSVIHCGQMLPGAHRGRTVAVTVALPGWRAVYR
jgi:hypothetical protein